MRFLVLLIVNAAAIWVADWLLDGISLAPTSSTGTMLLELGLVALVFTLVNLFVRPVVALLSLPFYILTLGLFFLVVNALMLMLTGWLTSFTGFGLQVDGFWNALLGGLVIAIASWILQLIIPGDQR
jgi:putative membrane protein